MGRELSRPVAALALLALAACPPLRSPEERVRAAVERLQRDGFTGAVDGATLRVERGDLHLSEPTVVPGGRGGLEVFGQLSVDGRLDGTPFSYLGTERMAVRCEATGCRVDGPPAPRLQGVLSALRARRLALAGGGDGLRAIAAPEAALDLEALPRAAERSPAAWFIRVDRDEAVVGEADRSGVQHRLELSARDGRWVFTGGLP